MSAVFQTIRLLALIVFTVVAAAVGTAYYFASRSLPDYAGDAVVDGVIGPVEIIRDQRAVPHIFAGAEADAYFALGYAHAQDRLWQMVLRRRLAQGRVTELAGDWGRRGGRRGDLLRLDLTARALDLEGRAARSLEVFSPETLAVLDAYAAGVNAWLKRVDEERLGRGAPELMFLGAEVAPWRPVDSVTAMKLYAAFRSGGFLGELTRARFLAALGAERARDLFPSVAGPAIPAPPAFGAPAPEAASPEIGAAPPPVFFDRGGHAWAAAGARSASRAPLFATEAQAPLSAPGQWYIARLSFGPAAAPDIAVEIEPEIDPEAEGAPAAPAPRGAAPEEAPEPPTPEALAARAAAAEAETRELIGATLPGAPAILFGRNKELAWGATSLAADVGDLFIEKLDPDDPDRYQTPEGWAAFETREAAIPLGDGKALAAALRATRHGPVLPLDWPEIAAVTPEGHVAALAWTVLAEDDRSLEAALGLSRATDVFDALKAVEGHVAPPQTLMLADRRSIALAAVGRIPRRDRRSRAKGVLPASGWRAENDWLGWADPLDAPRVIDPPSGLLAHADNRIGGAAFPDHIGYDWAAPYRIDRLTKLLNAREFHTIDSFQSVQTDTVSEMARSVLPLIAGALWRARSGETGARREALDRLAAWNGDMDAFLAEPLIFAAWTRALTRRLTKDELGPLAAAFDGARPEFLERVYRDQTGAGARWCDDIRTETAESCAAMSSLALDDALRFLSKRYGDRVSGWRWGRAHEAAHEHAPFGEARLIGALLSVRQETGGGDHTMLRGRQIGGGRKPFQNVVAGGFRAIYDFRDLDRSLFAVGPGQSGHFLSRHYDDFADLWRAGEYAPLSLDRQDAEAGSVGVIRLRPPPIPSPAPPAAPTTSVAAPRRRGDAG
ncbi:MAG: penicillin acylase family protein [Pseudomonadota bacterium]